MPERTNSAQRIEEASQAIGYIRLASGGLTSLIPEGFTLALVEVGEGHVEAMFEDEDNKTVVVKEDGHLALIVTVSHWYISKVVSETLTRLGRAASNIMKSDDSAKKN